MCVCIERFFKYVKNIVDLVKDLSKIPFYFYPSQRKPIFLF